MIYLIPKKKREEFRTTDRFKAILSEIEPLHIKNSYTIGNISELIKKYNTYEEWREGYFSSGSQREEILSGLDNLTRKANTDYSYFIFKGKLPQEYVPYINEDYGRTKEDLCTIAEILKKDFEEKEIDFSLEEIFATIYVYVIQIPWEEKERG